MKAYGTIPIGYPVKSQDRRYRHPLDQVRHWNVYESTQYRPHAMVDFYESTIRPFTMYRDREDLRRLARHPESIGRLVGSVYDRLSQPGRRAGTGSRFLHTLNGRPETHTICPRTRS